MPAAVGIAIERKKYIGFGTQKKSCILSSGYICSEVHNASNVPNKTTGKT